LSMPPPAYPSPLPLIMSLRSYKSLSRSASHTGKMTNEVFATYIFRGLSPPPPPKEEIIIKVLQFSLTAYACKKRDTHKCYIIHSFPFSCVDSHLYPSVPFL
jgi:hypothetical protein